LNRTTAGDGVGVSTAVCAEPASGVGIGDEVVNGSAIAVSF
jgi:hypothetical protein